MNKVVYLLGAGASANALPVVKEISGKIEEVIRTINEFELSEKDGFPTIRKTNKMQRDYQVSLVEDLEWLKDKAGTHATIDTFAKKVYLTNDPNREMKRLKIALSAFFAIEQMKKRDNRYDIFLASILNHKAEFSNDVFILTWNYDQQMEFALREYNEAEILKICEKGVPPQEDLFMYKMNGSAAFYNFASQNREKSWGAHPINFKFVSEDVENAVRNFAFANDSELNPLLSFAWEEETIRNLENLILPKLITAEVLVVIGYSFPFFNREVDRKIIAMMPNLKTIYFQDKNPSNIIDRFQSISSRKIDKYPVSDIEQFFLPPEL